MDSYVAFESLSEKNKLREQRRNEKAEILAKAESEYRKREARKKRAELQGEGSWMLPSVEDRINSEQKEEKKSVRKKEKKHKKEKKKKKKKKHHRSSSSSDSEDSQVWVQKPVAINVNDTEPNNIEPKLQRDSWMTEDVSFASTFVPSSRRSRDAVKPNNQLLDKLGQHRLELNPYWKDGGTGLPEIDTSKSSVSSGSAGDAGLSWLRKSLQRCLETAKEENRPVEEVAAERHGSLQELQNQIAAAEAKCKSSSSLRSSLGFRKPNDDDDFDHRELPRQSNYKSQNSDWRKKQQEPSHSISNVQQNTELKVVEKKVATNEETDESSEESKSSEDVNLSKDEEPCRKLLSEEEINKLGAQIIKAELLGDEDTVQQLKKQLEHANKIKSANKTAAVAAAAGSKGSKTEEEMTLLTRTSRSGMTQPLPGRKHPVETSHGRRRRKAELTHDSSGKRTKFFDDDDKYSLKNLVERERLSTAEDSNKMFARLAGRHAQGDDEDMDDKLLDKAAFKQSASLMESRERQLAVIEQKKMSATLEKCGFCFENSPRHLIIAIGLKVYLCLPKYQSVAEGHCFIVPIQHETQGTKCDEDVWDEIKIFEKGLSAMFKDADKDCIFMETSINLKRYPHAHVECIPVPKEIGDVAPIYFKKALMECESEWSQNKKIVDLSKKDIRQAIPKGFPYFSVQFGMEGGYAHVVEDEKSFTSYFGREVVGGMLELDATLWRRPHNETFEEQRKKVLKFADQWKLYDWTKRLKST